jgi:uncharacterized membrane protein YfcA
MSPGLSNGADALFRELQASRLLYIECMPNSLMTYALLCLSALAAGVVNSIAGGGTLLTFPTLLRVVSPVVANATSTVALVPGSLAGAWGYRREMHELSRWTFLLIGPSLLGGLVGSLLLILFDEQYFSRLIPWLILLAAALFLIQPLMAKLIGIGKPHRPPSVLGLLGVILFQFLVAVYGGYFGAGIGILMLSALSIMGLGDIHRMNALKTFLAVWINGISVAVFVWSGQVNWRYGLVMAVAAIVGGYLGARIARLLNRTLVRWMVVAIGFGLAGYYFYKQRSASDSPVSEEKPAMGMEQIVTYANGKPPTWPAVRDLLATRGFAVQLRMIDGELSLPDEEPPPDWHELRLGTPLGMVTVRREAERVEFVTWGNADAALQQAWNALTWAFAAAGGGQVQTPGGTLTAANYQLRADLPAVISQGAKNDK